MSFLFFACFVFPGACSKHRLLCACWVPALAACRGALPPHCKAEETEAQVNGCTQGLTASVVGACLCTGGSEGTSHHHYAGDCFSGKSTRNDIKAWVLFPTGSKCFCPFQGLETASGPAGLTQLPVRCRPGRDGQGQLTWLLHPWPLPHQPRAVSLGHRGSPIPPQPCNHLGPYVGVQDGVQASGLPSAPGGSLTCQPLPCVPRRSPLLPAPVHSCFK